MAKSEKMRREARRTRRVLIGTMVLLLMALGVFSILASATGFIRSFFDDSEEKLYYAEFITPLVLLDPLPFESLEKAPQNTLRQAAIWLALSKEDNTGFERDEYGSLYLPTAVVDNWALTLFGPEYKLTHETFVDSGLQFRYDEQRLSYIIPITAQPTNYIPIVVEIENDGDLKRLTVGYKLPAGASLENMTSDSAPIKYLDYILKRYGDGYFIDAIVESETKVETIAAQTTSQVETTPDAPNSISENLLEQAIIEQETDMANSSTSNSGSVSSSSSEEGSDSLINSSSSLTEESSSVTANSTDSSSEENDS